VSIATDQVIQRPQTPSPRRSRHLVPVGLSVLCLSACVFFTCSSFKRYLIYCCYFVSLWSHSLFIMTYHSNVCTLLRKLVETSVWLLVLALQWNVCVVTSVRLRLRFRHTQKYWHTSVCCDSDFAEDWHVSVLISRARINNVPSYLSVTHEDYVFLLAGEVGKISIHSD
jgi:hypothetical protein